MEMMKTHTNEAKKKSKTYLIVEFLKEKYINIDVNVVKGAMG